MDHPQMNQKRNVGVNEGGRRGERPTPEGAGCVLSNFLSFFLFFCHPFPPRLPRESPYFHSLASNEPNFGISLFGQGIYHLCSLTRNLGHFWAISTGGCLGVLVVLGFIALGYGVADVEFWRDGAMGEHKRVFLCLFLMSNSKRAINSRLYSPTRLNVRPRVRNSGLL